MLRLLTDGVPNREAQRLGIADRGCVDGGISIGLVLWPIVTRLGKGFSSLAMWVSMGISCMNISF